MKPKPAASAAERAGSAATSTEAGAERAAACPGTDRGLRPSLRRGDPDRQPRRRHAAGARDPGHGAAGCGRGHPPHAPPVRPSRPGHAPRELPRPERRRARSRAARAPARRGRPRPRHRRGHAARLGSRRRARCRVGRRGRHRRADPRPFGGAGGSRRVRDCRPALGVRGLPAALRPRAPDPPGPGRGRSAHDGPLRGPGPARPPRSRISRPRAARTGPPPSAAS